MVFQRNNIRQVPWEVLKTAASGLGFQYLPRDLANVNALKTMFDPYYKEEIKDNDISHISKMRSYCICQHQSQFRAIWQELLLSTYSSTTYRQVSTFEKGMICADT